MAAFKGDDFKLKQSSTATGSTYNDVAAITVTGLTGDSNIIEATTKDSGGWIESIKGNSKIAISASGLVNAGANFDLLQQAAIDEVSATGTVTFTANPTTGDDIVINGVDWEFTASASAAGNTQIQGDLSATLEQFEVDLETFGTSAVQEAEYFITSGTTLNVRHNKPGTVGNAFTLATGAQGAANIALSGATLTGGALSTVPWNFRLADTSGTRITGSFLVENFEQNGESDGVHEFSMTLTSTGSVTII